jgi:mycothiol synthase
MEIVEIHDAELDRLVAMLRSGDENAGSADEYRDWKRQARETIWLVAVADQADIGAAIGVGGWHEPEGAARVKLVVDPTHRRRGAGSGLLKSVGSWAKTLGYGDLLASVKEIDAESAAWAQRRGYVEVGRDSKFVLELTSIERPSAAIPDGVRITTWAEHPEAAQGIYAVACEAYPDVPGDEDERMPDFENWLRMDMQGIGDRPDATFIAFAGDVVVGYAKLALSASRPRVAFHDMTGVRREWRGRGIAGALKRAEISWAIDNGYLRLETRNEERNEPIRRLNESHGYVIEPGSITLRGAISSDS